MSIGIIDTLALSRKRVSIGLVGTYVPQRCGIATFSKDIADALSKHNPLNKVEVAAVDDSNQEYKYPPEVKYRIAKDELPAYLAAAEQLNRSDIMLVNVQHEFGIFGGTDGEHILAFIKKLKKPVVTTLHTVLEKPASEHQRLVMEEICTKSSAVIVMLPYALKILTQVYNVPHKKIYVVPHGVPESNFLDSERIKKVLKLENNIILSTFGLLSHGKGLEYALEALPAIAQEHPSILYLIIGATHPQVLKKEGEAYRQELEVLVKKLKLEKNVKFINSFIDLDELVRYLLATDVYIVPYLNKDQISSGTLSYAIGCGKAIVSTPFIYAEEMLKENKGILVNFRDSTGLALAVNRILGDHKLKATLEENTYTFGRQMIWPTIADDLIRLFQKINHWQRIMNFLYLIEQRVQNKISRILTKSTKNSQQVIRQTVSSTIFLLQGYPALRFSHLYRMTDEVGIFQHANFNIPNKKEGYTLDDNARALIMMTQRYNIKPENKVKEYIYRYLSFVHYAYNGDGTFRNFMGFDRRWLEDRGSEDSIGRAIWALGFAYYNFPKESVGYVSERILTDIFRQFPVFTSLRASAFALMGLCYFFHYHPERLDLQKKIIELADLLVQAFNSNSQKSWQWFEPHLTYTNGRLPHALLLAYTVTKNKKYLEIAERSLGFLKQILIIDDTLIIIGNAEWYMRDGVRSFYDQQPIDAGSMAEVFLFAYLVTRNKKYYHWAKTSFNWFFGKNTLKKPLIDAATGACHDGLLAGSLNENQGAESTIAYMSAYLNMLYVKEHIDLPIIDNLKNKMKRSR